MSLRNFFLLVAVWGLFEGCKNEPYEKKPLAIIGLINHATNTTSTYKYRDGEIRIFTLGTSSTRFHYNNGVLEYMIGDSTYASHKLTRFHSFSPATSIDSTFIIYTDSATRVIDSIKSVATRTIQYDNSLRPISVYRKTWNDTIVSEELAELTWNEAGNVSDFRYTDQLKAAITAWTIDYDDQPGIYTVGPDYVFTVPASQMFHLSANNPLTFNNSTGEKKYTYWYNTMGYPSNFQSDVNVVFGVSYTQMQ